MDDAERDVLDGEARRHRQRLRLLTAGDAPTAAPHLVGLDSGGWFSGRLRDTVVVHQRHDSEHAARRAAMTGLYGATLPLPGARSWPVHERTIGLGPDEDPRLPAQDGRRFIPHRPPPGASRPYDHLAPVLEELALWGHGVHEPWGPAGRDDGWRTTVSGAIDLERLRRTFSLPHTVIAVRDGDGYVHITQPWVFSIRDRGGVSRLRVTAVHQVPVVVPADPTLFEGQYSHLDALVRYLQGRGHRSGGWRYSRADDSWNVVVRGRLDLDRLAADVRLPSTVALRRLPDGGTAVEDRRRRVTVLDSPGRRSSWGRLRAVVLGG